MHKFLTSPWFWVAFWIAVLVAYWLLNNEGCPAGSFYEDGIGCA